TAARMVVAIGSPHSGQTSRTDNPSSRYPHRLHGRLPESVLASAAGGWLAEELCSGGSIGKGTSRGGRVAAPGPPASCACRVCQRGLSGVPFQGAAGSGGTLPDQKLRSEP